MAANTNLESERNRGNERRIAVWGVFAALAAALIGSAAAIGGGILGANIQASSNKTEGDREFTQTQELTLYSKFMQSAQSVYDDAFYFVQSAEAAQYGKTSNSTTTMKNRRTTLATAQQEMNLIIYQLHIVGSDVAYKAALSTRTTLKLRSRLSRLRGVRRSSVLFCSDSSMKTERICQPLLPSQKRI
jgi:hypothetical protein